MSEGISRAVARQARQIIRIERWLVFFSALFMIATLAASLYFEHAFGLAPYSLALTAGFFLVSFACFTALFALFGESFRDRRKRGTRTLFMLASVVVVAAALVAYVLAFGLYGLQVPWLGDGRDHLYVCYFLLSAAAVFLARSATFYWRLRAYIVQSLGSLNK